MPLESPEQRNDFELYVLVRESEEGAPTEALKMPWSENIEKVDTEKFTKAYDNVLEAIKYMCGKAQNLMSEYSVDEISVHLGVSAEGGLLFVSKVGVDADIDITIKRK